MSAVTAVAGLPSGNAELRVDTQPGGTVRIVASGDWSIGNLAGVDTTLRDIESGLESAPVTFDVSAVHHFGTAAAWLVERMRRAADGAGAAFDFVEPDAERAALIRNVREEARGPVSPPKVRTGFNPIARLGTFIVGLGRDLVEGLYLTGAAVEGPQMKPGMRRGIRWKSLITHLDRIGLRAVPVVAVMSLLIGAILAQQTSFQLRGFGEEGLTLALVGILLLREIGVLLTAIMVAGRSGSAITAEIGAMRMREEIDALKVIGLNPIAVLVLPRLLALMIAVPVLTFIADVAGMLGAIAVAWMTIDTPISVMLDTFLNWVNGTQFFVGLFKAPVMAFAIGLIAAMEGLKVAGSAESLGTHVTAAVVRAIFVVILVDGLFAIFFTSIGI